jgi:hypothetical protein
MNSPKLSRLATGRFGRAGVVVGLSGVMLAGSAGAALAAVGTEPGEVQLNPTSGATSSKPTWSTGVGCNAGFQGSAVFREVHADGVTTNSISPAVNDNDLTGSSVAEPFSGTLQATMAQIQSLGGIATGGTQELVVICFSGASETGTSDPEMDAFITYNADGTYGSFESVPVPVGELGGIALMGLAAIGLGWMQFRRLRSRRTPASTSAP